MEKLLVINASPRENGVSKELENQVVKYFEDECEIIKYNVYDLEVCPCDDCKFCETNSYCKHNDLNQFFLDFQSADFVAIFTPVYNSFIPGNFKVLLDRFQSFFVLKYVLGQELDMFKNKNIGVVISAGSNSRQACDYIFNTFKSFFKRLNGNLCSRYYILNTDIGKYTFNLIELEKFIQQLKG